MKTEMNLQRISVDKLKPAKYKPRKDPKPGAPAYEKIKCSLHDFGYVDPVIWNEVTGYVRFEKENIYTADPTAEFVFNLLSVVAQGESRSLSENIRWAHRERIKHGEYNLGSNRVLEYDTIDGKLTPNADAWIVREIFRRFVAGEGYREIIRNLTGMGAKPLRGEAFHIETLRRILRDETYVGNKFLQKDAPTGFFTKRPDKSLYYDSYYLKDDHEGVISRELWDKAREMITKQESETKTGIHRKGKEHHVLYGKAFCGECDAFRNFSVLVRIFVSSRLQSLRMSNISVPGEE